jgi:hypothetical protein
MSSSDSPGSSLSKGTDTKKVVKQKAATKKRAARPPFEEGDWDMDLEPLVPVRGPTYPYCPLEFENVLSECKRVHPDHPVPFQSPSAGLV